jgi:hypothetical protein
MVNTNHDQSVPPLSQTPFSLSPDYSCFALTGRAGFGSPVRCRHEAGAKTIRDLINELKGFYVSLGYPRALKAGTAGRKGLFFGLVLLKLPLCTDLLHRKAPPASFSQNPGVFREDTGACKIVLPYLISLFRSNFRHVLQQYNHGKILKIR